MDFSPAFDVIMYRQESDRFDGDTIHLHNDNPLWIKRAARQHMGGYWWFVERMLDHYELAFASVGLGLYVFDTKEEANEYLEPV
jgi:hypothetical protein